MNTEEQQKIENWIMRHLGDLALEGWVEFNTLRKEPGGELYGYFAMRQCLRGLVKSGHCEAQYPRGDDKRARYRLVQHLIGETAALAE